MRARRPKDSDSPKVKTARACAFLTASISVMPEVLCRITRQPLVAKVRKQRCRRGGVICGSRVEILLLTASDARRIAANPTVEVVSTADIPAELVEKEKAIEMGKEDLASKPRDITVSSTKL
eukprot:1196364-Prorocentrum_minimum.AAC.1